MAANGANKMFLKQCPISFKSLQSETRNQQQYWQSVTKLAISMKIGDWLQNWQSARKLAISHKVGDKQHNWRLATKLAIGKN